MVTAPHAPTPFSPVLEDAYAPSAERIAESVRSVVRRAVFGKPVAGKSSSSNWVKVKVTCEPPLVFK